MSTYISAFEMSVLRILARERKLPPLTDLCHELGEIDRVKVERAARRMDALARQGIARFKRDVQTGMLDRGSGFN